MGAAPIIPGVGFGWAPSRPITRRRSSHFSALPAGAHFLYPVGFNWPGGGISVSWPSSHVPIRLDGDPLACHPSFVIDREWSNFIYFILFFSFLAF